jgi:hypothetical protein
MKGIQNEAQLSSTTRQDLEGECRAQNDNNNKYYPGKDYPPY